METLQDSLGQFYLSEHSNSPPTFVQVVGWTPAAERPEAKRRHVYVRHVPLKITTKFGGGGKWEYDNDAINRYRDEIKEPIAKPSEKGVDGNAIMIDGAHFLRYQSRTLSIRKV
jgi:hypothetical protein